jgi:hypothetical protein
MLDDDKEIAKLEPLRIPISDTRGQNLAFE